MPLEIFNHKTEKYIQENFIDIIEKNNIEHLSDNLLEIYKLLYSNIPDKKRISYGGYYIVKTLGEYLYNMSISQNINILKTSSDIYDISTDRKVKGITLCIISFYGLDKCNEALQYIKRAAEDEDWEMREFAAGFINKLTKKYPDEIKEFYLELVKSENPYLRRFVSESLRPVAENSWFIKDPDYPLSIIKHLYKEKSEYPRTSVGNNLSDWSKRKPDLVYEIVKKLVKNNNKNSYWIATRACRNLVKKEPIKVMDILKIDEYKYKKNIYKREDF